MRLSEERAVRAANLLVKHGVDARLLRPVGYGNKFPVEDKRTEDARAKNRRVDFLILERKQ